MNFFRIDEFLPKEYWSYDEYRKFGFIDSRILDAVELIRLEAGHPVTINNGATYNESGLRLPQHATYKCTSQHSFGRAVDLKCTNLGNAELYKLVTDTLERRLLDLGITTVESILDTPTWVHIDCRTLEGGKQEKLLIVRA